MKKELTYHDLNFVLGDKMYQWLDGYRTAECPMDIMFTESEYKLISEIFKNVLECIERRYGDE